MPKRGVHSILSRARWSRVLRPRADGESVSNIENQSGLSAPASRRDLLVRGLVGFAGVSFIGSLLGGCSGGGSRASASLPDTRWPDLDRNRVAGKRWEPLPDAPALEEPGIIPRSSWAQEAPVPRLMDRADRAYTRITLHHDGMPDPFYSTDRWAAASRLERIRKAHRQRNFGDIGYHYVIDPAGRVWEGRQTVWQGAHVKDQNPGNLGICVLGNYMLQRPTDTQLAAVERFVAVQMANRRIALGQVKTHQERAPTECPGKFLQPQLLAMRSTRGTLARVV